MTVAELVHRYFERAAGPDREAYFALFAADAVVEDEGKVRTGIEEIRIWRAEVVPVSYRVQEIRRTDDEADAHDEADADDEADVHDEADASVEIAGDFAGSPVTLVFRFEFTGDDISRLTIRG